MGELDGGLSILGQLTTAVRCAIMLRCRVRGREMHHRDVKAEALRTGDKLFWTLETVVRTFRDRMTPEDRVNVLLRKGESERVACYKGSRKIRLIAE